ncbi:KEOPS complex subunit Cgi121 [[Eubacterium] cellulosolvens]
MILVKLKEFKKYLGYTFIEGAAISDPKEIFKNFSTESDLISQLLNPRLLIGESHIYFGVINALNSFKKNWNISRHLSIEILLYLSGQRQIEKAFKMFGIQEGIQDIVVICIGQTDDRIAHFIDNAVQLLGGQVNDGKIEQWSNSRKRDVIAAYDITEKEIFAIQQEDENSPDGIKKILIERMALLSL